MGKGVKGGIMGEGGKKAEGLRLGENGKGYGWEKGKD